MSDEADREPVAYLKLVRDRVPEIAEGTAKGLVHRSLDHAELKEALSSKLLEESYRLSAACRKESPEGILEAAAELLESLAALLSRQGLSIEQALEVQAERRARDGGYTRGILLETEGLGFPEWVVEGAPSLILSRIGDEGLLSRIREELRESTHAWILSAFYSPGILNLLLDDFRRFIDAGGLLHVLLSTMGNVTRPEYLPHLNEFVPGIRLRVYHPAGIPYDRQPPNFHPKAYLFRRRDGRGAMIIGSSNLTLAGFRENIEWNYYTSVEVNLPLDGPSPFHRAVTEFSSYWDQDAAEVTEDFLEGYRQRWTRAARLRHDWFESAAGLLEGAGEPVRPNEVQEATLATLREFREEGLNRAAVVAATGVGKTYLAALDYRQSGMERILYIAHREIILERARQSFRAVLGDPGFGTVLGGGREPSRRPSAAFAMIQTLSRRQNLDTFPPGHFDYIVVDEFHHASAASYRRVLDHFRPRFLLGLTATPERMDGRDVLALCEYNLAAEVRLLDAVDQGVLVPFQYFAVHDDTDYSRITWRGTHYDEEELDRVLMDDTRTEIVARNLKKFMPSSGKIKALAFCSTVAHARYTARKLHGRHGIEAVALVGDSREDARAEAIRRIRDEEDPLNVICAVDIFNEGVDIPELSHVLFLRPTQSFTVFLQQLGRGLRRAPGKAFLLAVDLVGNFRKAHVAPLALRGYTSVEEYRAGDAAALRAAGFPKSLPRGCHVSPDVHAQRIWDEEIRRILSPRNREERLRELYLEILHDLGTESPSLMDFFANPHGVDPVVFIKAFEGWMRAKLACRGTLDEREKALLDTPGEGFLKHLEMELNPVRSYKMVVLQTLLGLPGTSWKVDDIARGFLDHFLEHRERIADYEDLARAADPAKYPVSRVVSKLKEMPLRFLSNKKGDWFALDRHAGVFGPKPEVRSCWQDGFFRELVRDRVEYGLARYFHQRRKRDHIHYSERLFLESLPISEGLALSALGGEPLPPGERRSAALAFQDTQYEAELSRSGDSGTYRLRCPPESPLPAKIQEVAQGRFRKGDRAFTLSVKEGGAKKKGMFLLRPLTGKDLRGIVVEIPYAKNRERGFTREFRDLISSNPGKESWTLEFHRPGYTGDMDVEIREGETFLAWTGSRYDDPTRFPARIKAAASALFAEGLRGGFRMAARSDRVEIRREKETS